VPPSRSDSFLRRRIIVAAVAIVVLAILFYLPLTLLAPVPTTKPVRTGYSAPTTTTQVLSLPTYGDSAIAAVGYPGLLASGGGSTPLPIASITKIITALVVLQKAPLTGTEDGPSITFTAADEAILKSYASRDGDVYPIQVGGSMTERQVLTVALVPSANNYSRALADWAYGSEANFLPVAKAWLLAHGMTSTTLTDCTGLNPQNTSTPTDLIALGKLALANPVIAGLVKTPQVTLPVVGTVTNTNQLLGQLGIDGIKTGTLIPQGSSLLFSSRLTLGGHVVTLIGVVLDGPNHPTIDAAIATLVKAARDGFHLVTLATRGERFASYSSAWGDRTTAIAARTVRVVVWGGTSIKATVTVGGIKPAKAGTVVGLASFSAGVQHLSVPLKLSAKLVGPGALWRLGNPGQLL
jgi:serine-type D-Ala-D-Ala carboxypeptidase (penicillin-binding protein 5/6)